MILVDDGQGRSRRGGKRDTAEYQTEINRDTGQPKNNAEHERNKYKGTDRLYKGNADDLFAGLCKTV